MLATVIPGNFLAEGMLFVAAALASVNPSIKQFYERDVVAFHVVDSMDGDSARGNYAGRIPGVVRPSFNWETRFTPNGHH
jgi:lipopolysaccharide transport system ATP-binding protein